MRVKRYQFVFLVIALICGSCGCNVESLSPYKSLPTPLVDGFPYEIPEARNMRMWGGDNFEIIENDLTHYLVLEGIDSPKPDQDFFHESRRHMFRMIKGKKFRVVVLKYDDMKREIARVYLGDKNLNLEMVKAGMAWWDRTECEGFEEIKAAEAKAREAKKGLWKLSNPVHPSEFESD